MLAPVGCHSLQVDFPNNRRTRVTSSVNSVQLNFCSTHSTLPHPASIPHHTPPSLFPPSFMCTAGITHHAQLGGGQKLTNDLAQHYIAVYHVSSSWVGRKTILTSRLTDATFPGTDGRARDRHCSRTCALLLSVCDVNLAAIMLGLSKEN